MVEQYDPKSSSNNGLLCVASFEQIDDPKNFNVELDNAGPIDGVEYCSLTKEAGVYTLRVLKHY